MYLRRTLITEQDFKITMICFGDPFAESIEGSGKRHRSMTGRWIVTARYSTNAEKSARASAIVAEVASKTNHSLVA